MPLKHLSKTQERGSPGTLYVVATPIGHLLDITLRALETLKAVHCVAAEDTRHTRKLLSHYNIHKPLLSYHTHNAGERAPQFIAKLLSGEDLALVTDAGTPGVSDPGMLLVRRALEYGVPVSVIPGPSAAIAALVVSGLSTYPFAFLGFPPSRGEARRQFLITCSTLPMTLVLYESPKRLVRTLQDILHMWGDRPMAVARELTKLYEEVFRGKVSEALEHFLGEVRGEVTLVVSGCDAVCERLEKEPAWQEDILHLIKDEKLKVKEAVEIITGRYSVSRRLVYGEALRIKGSSDKRGE